MIMTEEQKKWDDEFQSFLLQVDIENAEYFASNEINVNSVRLCFATINGDKLRYSKGRNLRHDIYNAVIEKHKELWKELHDFKIVD